MQNELHVFLPARQVIIIYSIVLGLLMTLSMVLVIKYGGILLWILLLLTTFAFIFVFVPVLRNTKMLMFGNDIKLSIYGKWHDMNFSKDLFEIVVKGNEVQSYRFKCNGNFYQISPNSYYEADEVSKLLGKLLEKYKGSISIINR
ncbi:MAG: hypothetical protein ED859_15110 [Desulfuromonadales bacterium]|nr:MAG: hypothetical protein ED859_15110 [Desulfuromonadales bacterium]